MPPPSSNSRRGRPVGHPGCRGAPVRLIKRYANRNLYDTGTGEPTSLRRIEQLVRAGVDIRVVEHDTGEDTTSEILVGILAASIGDHSTAVDVELLASLIRAPDGLLAAISTDAHTTEELQVMGERVRLLASAIDALLRQVDNEGYAAIASRPA